MKYRKVIVTLMLLLLVAALFPISAAAAGSTSGSCGSNVQYSYSESSKTLTISGSGRMQNYSTAANSTPWSSYSGEIEKVVVRSGVTYIGDFAFYYMRNLTSVSLADTVTEIGEGAFRKSGELQEVKLPSGLKTIGDTAFMESGIPEITVPTGVTTIGDSLFKDCYRLESVTIKGTVDGIGPEAFYDCPVLEEVTIAGAKSDAEIGEMAFYKCVSLENIQIPKGVWLIDTYAFSHCESLKTITLPDSLQNIYANAFEYCESLTTVTLPQSVDYLESCGYIFYGCTNLRNVTLPSAALKNLHWSVFRDCTALRYIHVIGNAPKVDADDAKNAFEDATSSFTVYYDAGTSGWKDTFCGSPTAVWDATEKPELTVDNNASSGKPRLKWKIVEDAASYQVYRSTSKNGTYTRIKSTSATSYTDTSAETGICYYYKVKAIYGDKSYVFGKVVSRTCDLPRPVISLSNVESTGKVRITWDAVEGAVEYKVYRSTSKSGKYTLLKTTTSTAMTNTSAKAGETYYYKVRAIAEESAANSAYSSIKYRTCDLARPAISLSNVESTGKVRITWDAVEGAAKYKVYRSTSKNGDYTLLKTTTSTAMTNTSAKAGETYYYKVRAIAEESAANSAYSAIKYRTCDLAQPKLTVELDASGNPVLSWAAVEGAEAYTVYRAVGADGEFEKLENVAETTLTDGNVVSGETYSYKVTASCSVSAAASACSGVVSVTIP